jgi:hypothetical protein
METMKKAGLENSVAISFLTDTNRLDAITNAASHGNTIIIDAGSNKDLASMAAMLESVKGR